MTVPSGGGGGQGSDNPVKIFCNIFISFIGAGVLGLPFAFKKAGILEGIVVMVFVSYFSVRAMLLLVECKYTILKRYGVSTNTTSSRTASADRSPLMPMTNNGDVANGRAAEDSDDEMESYILLGHDQNESDTGMRQQKVRHIPQDDLTYGDVGG